MYIADMHCDSLSRVTADRGLRTRYNLSVDNPQLQLFAHYSPRGIDTPEVRRARLMHALDIYISECKRLDFVPVCNCHDLNFAVQCELSSAIFAVEGGAGLFADSPELTTLYQLGLRVLGIAWDTNELATSSFDTTGEGLTEAGRALVTRASEMGIILDLSHLSDRSAYEVMDLTPYPVIATHSNFREVCDHPRCLPRDIASAIAKRGGVIGLSLYPPHLSSAAAVRIDDIMRHIDYALEHFGEDVIGFGFDIDGTDGVYPEGLSERDSIHDAVVDMLLSHYSTSTVEKIVGGNVIEFFKNNL